MGWFWNDPQLDRIENTLTYLTIVVIPRIERKLATMSAQEQALNDALTGFFATINDGLARIEAKLAEAGTPVDLSQEITAIQDAQTAFQARVDADAPPPASG